MFDGLPQLEVVSRVPDTGADRCDHYLPGQWSVPAYQSRDTGVDGWCVQCYRRSGRGSAPGESVWRTTLRERSTISRNLKILEGKDLIAYEDNPADQRSKFVVLTAHAQSLKPKIFFSQHGHDYSLSKTVSFEILQSLRHPYAAIILLLLDE